MAARVRSRAGTLPTRTRARAQALSLGVLQAMTDPRKPSIWEVPEPFKSVLAAVPADCKRLYVVRWLQGTIPVRVYRTEPSPSGDTLLQMQRQCQLGNHGFTVQTLTARELRDLIFMIGKAVRLIPDFLMLSDDC